MKRGVTSHVRRLEAGWSGRVFRGNRSHKGRGAPCCKPILGVRSGGGLGYAEEPYDVAYEVVGRLLDLT